MSPRGMLVSCAVALVGSGCPPGLEDSRTALARQPLSAGTAVEVDVRVRGPAPFSAANAQVATDGTDFLVAWESRSLSSPSARSSVVAARLSADGRALDAEPIALGWGYNPSVAPGAGGYLVVWTAALPDGGSLIAGRRVTSGGQLPEAAPFAVQEKPLRLDEPVVGWNGQHFVVAWAEEIDDISAVRVHPSGQVLGPTMSLSTGATWSDYTPRIACQPGECLAIWERLGSSWPRVTGTTIAADGTFQPARDLVPMIQEMYGEDVSTLGANYLIAYTRGDTRGNYWGRASRITPGLTSLDPGGFDTIDAGDSPGVPALAADGQRSVLASRGWNAGSAILAASIDVDAGSSHPAWVTQASLRSNHRLGIAVADGGTLIAWTAQVGSSGRLWTAKLAPSLQREWSTDALDSTENSQDSPALVATAGGFLAVFRDFRDGAALYRTSLDGAGRATAPASLAAPLSPISSPPRLSPTPHDAGVAVAWAVWGEMVGSSCTVVAVPLQLDGTPVADAGATMMTYFSCPTVPAIAVDTDGQSALIAWRNPASVGAFAARVTADGTTLDAPPVQIVDAGSPRELALAFDGTQHLVVWSHFDGQLFARRLTPSLSLLGPTTSLTPPGGSVEPVVLATPGGPFVVAWARATALGWNVLGTRVDSAGVALEPGGRLLTSAGHAPALFPHPEDAGYLLAVVDDTVSPPATTLIELGADLSPGAATLTFPGRQPAFARSGDQTLLIYTEDLGARPLTRVMTRLIAGDAGTPSTDAGNASDAGSASDAGTATPDAGSGGDAGEADAGAAQGPRRLTVGCSSTVGGAWLWLAGLTLAAGWRRRARPRGQASSRATMSTRS